VIGGAALLGGCSPLGALDAVLPRGAARVARGIPYGEGPRRQLDMYTAVGATGPRPLVVFFYGGSWQEGRRGDYRFVGEALAGLGCVAVLPDYRVWPEVGFPGFVEDAAAAVAWAAARAAELGADPGAVFVAGHSAGAHIALLLALDPRFLAAAGHARERLAGAIGLSGPYDFLPITRPDIVPIFAGVAPEATQPIGFADAAAPPLLLLHGAADRIVLPRNSLALAERVRAAGGGAEAKLYPEVGHAGTLLALAPWFSGRAPVLEDIGRFLARRV
jgi:acetyl esterase/lipase